MPRRAAGHASTSTLGRCGRRLWRVSSPGSAPLPTCLVRRCDGPLRRRGSGRRGGLDRRSSDVDRLARRAHRRRARAGRLGRRPVARLCRTPAGIAGHGRHLQPRRQRAAPRIARRRCCAPSAGSGRSRRPSGRPRIGPAVAPSRPRPGRRNRRDRRYIDRAAARIAEGVDIDRLLALARPAAPARRRIRARRSAARPTRRDRPRRGVLFCLSRIAAVMAAGRRGALLLLAARRRAARPVRRCGLSAGRLSRARGVPPRRRRDLFRRIAPGGGRRQARLRRVRRLYGIGRGPDRRRRPAPADGGFAAAGDKLCRTPPCRSAIATPPCSTTARSAPPARVSPDTSFTMRQSSRRARATGSGMPPTHRAAILAVAVCAAVRCPAPSSI